MSTRLKAILGAVALVASLISAFPVLSTTAATCPAPTLLEAMVSQGLPHNGVDKNGKANPPLVHGKQAVVKFFVGAAPGSLSTQVNAAASKLTVTGIVNNAPVTLGEVKPTANTSSILSTYTKTDNSNSDPKFIVPGSMLRATTDSWQATFTGNLSYTTQPTVGLSCTGTVLYTVSATVARQSRGLRLLLVRMVDGSDNSKPQFTTETLPGQKSNALEAVQNGLLSLSRILPVADGVDGLTASGSTAGIRWHLNAGMVKLNELEISKPDGKYCLNAGQFSKISTQLDYYLQSWNTEQLMVDPNSDRVADRVIGVIDSNISKGTESKNCWDGAAQVPTSTAPGMHGWARAIHDTTDAAAIVRDTGPLLAMEVQHTYGLKVPASLGGSGADSYHTTAATADTTNPNRGYNIFTGAYVPSPKPVMELLTPFTNDNTLEEQSDWADMLCALGGPDNLPTCTSTGGVVVTGSPTNVSAASRFYVSALSDGKPEDTPGLFGTEVTDSYWTTSKFETPEAADSEYHFVAFDSVGSVLVDKKVAFETRTSEHDDSAGGGLVPSPCPPPYAHETCGSFHFAVSLPTQPASWELRKAATTLVERFFDVKPVVKSVNVTVEPSAGPVNLTTDDTADETEPAITPKGDWLLYTRTPKPARPACSELVARNVLPSGALGSKTFYLPGGDTTPTCHSGMPKQGAWRADGNAGAFVKDGKLHVFDFDSSSGFKDVRVVLTCLGASGVGACLSSDGSQLSDIGEPSWSPDTDWPNGATGGSGYRLSFDASSAFEPGRRDLYFTDPYSPLFPPGLGDDDDDDRRGIHPAVLVAQRAVEGTWGHAAGKGKTLAYTDVSVSTGSPIRVVDIANSVLPTTGTEISCCGRRGSFGDRFMAIEEEADDGSPTGNIALLDYHNANKTPDPDRKSETGKDTSPSITSTRVAGEPFSQFLVFDRADSLSHEIYLWNLNTGDRRSITVSGTVATRNLPYASSTVAVRCNGVPNPFDGPLKPFWSKDLGNGLTAVKFKTSLNPAEVCGDPDGSDPAGDAPQAGATIDDQSLISDLVFGGGIGGSRKPPWAAILYTSGSAFSNADLNLVGSGIDPWFGAITAREANVWMLTRPDGSQIGPFTGAATSVPVPPGGFQPGLWKIAYTVSNAFVPALSATDTATVMMQVPLDPASSTDFDPNSVTLPTDTSGSPNVTVYITVPGLDLKKIPKSRVAVTSIDGVDVSSDTSLKANGWTANGSSAVATFDKAALATKIQSLGGPVPRLVRVTVTGTSGSTASSFGFTATDPSAPCAHLQNQGSTC